MRSLLSLLVLLSGPAWAGRTFYVPGDTGSLASALNQASQPGDTIHLGPGVYTLPANRVLTVPVSGDGVVTIVRANGAAGLMLGGGGSLRGLTLDSRGLRAAECSSETLVLQDVVFTDGGAEGDGLGGGLIHLDGCTASLLDVTLEDTDAEALGGLLRAVDSDVTVVGGIFRNGTGTRGGAFDVSGGSLRITGATFVGNTATALDGGAVYARDATVELVANTWSTNAAESEEGGALATRDCDVTVVGDVFNTNTAALGAGGAWFRGGNVEVRNARFLGNSSGRSGGMGCFATDSCTVTDTTFTDNSGVNGGALRFQDATAVFERNSFCDNSVTGALFTGNGGAVRVFGASDVEGEGNLYVNNSATAGGALSTESGGTYRHATVVGHSASTGSGVVVAFADATFVDSAFVGQSGSEALVRAFANPPAVDTCLFDDNTSGAANFSLNATNLFDDDPLFVDGADLTCDRAAFAPLAGSPLIDAGSGPDDLDGSPSDIGAIGGPTHDAVDADGDGIPASRDCDDSEPALGTEVLRFPDGDGDGFGGLSAVSVGCPEPGLVGISGDCDDSDPDVFPGAPELLNLLDDDCDLEVDEGGQLWFADTDSDGFGDPEQTVVAALQPAGFVDNDDDCDDTAELINPDAAEVCDVGELDEDCDGLTNDADPSVAGQLLWPRDDDGDGFGALQATLLACFEPANTPATMDDCDDGNSAINPTAAEVCDAAHAVDENCDGRIDDADPTVTGRGTFFVDLDGDGSAGLAMDFCDPPSDAADVALDCDETDASIFPGASEVCDPANVDENCNGLADDADQGALNPTAWHPDADGDGFGAFDLSVLACDVPEGHLADDSDCDDGDASVVRFTFYIDEDGDTFAGTAVEACVPPEGSGLVAEDCDDADALISPAAFEVCDPVDRDEDCSGAADDADPNVTDVVLRFEDVDGDGFGNAAVSSRTCDGAGVENDTDCDDTDSAVGPPVLRYPDLDGDGFGDASAPGSITCIGALTATDCNDGNAAVNPAATEVWYDGSDDDCDGNDDDQDGDGIGQATDCNDLDATVYPGAFDVPDDAVDQDCDGVVASYAYGNAAQCGCSGTPIGTSWWMGLGVLGLIRGSRRRESL